MRVKLVKIIVDKYYDESEWGYVINREFPEATNWEYIEPQELRNVENAVQWYNQQNKDKLMLLVDTDKTIPNLVSEFVEHQSKVQKEYEESQKLLKEKREKEKLKKAEKSLERKRKQLEKLRAELGEN